MKGILTLPAVAVGAFLTGCASPPPGYETGPHGTIAYHVPVEASEPGVKIYVNGQYAGITPLTLKIFGDRDGTFHDFGSYVYVVQAMPTQTNQFPQTRAFGTGRNFTHEDKIPERIYFDMHAPPSYPPPGYPPQGYPPPGYPPPYYYPPPPYYWPRYYYGPRY